MDADTPEIVEAVIAAIEPFCDGPDTQPTAAAHAAIAEGRPFILEEAAKVADWRASVFRETEGPCALSLTEECEDIAQAIRSLSKDGEGLDDHRG